MAEIYVEYSPRDCVDGLVEDLNRIKARYIPGGRFQTALERWEEALFQRHYSSYRQRIAEELHCGLSFVGTTEYFILKLNEGNSRNIDRTIRRLLAFGAQTHLPKRADA